MDGGYSPASRTKRGEGRAKEKRVPARAGDGDSGRKKEKRQWVKEESTAEQGVRVCVFVLSVFAGAFACVCKRQEGDREEQRRKKRDGRWTAQRWAIKNAQEATPSRKCKSTFDYITCTLRLAGLC